MPLITYGGQDYSCAKAIKGLDYIELLDSNNNLIGKFAEISDFSGFSISGGGWSEPEPIDEIFIPTASLTNGNIVISSNEPIGTGTLLKFTAPCSDVDVTGGLKINDTVYTVVDSLGNTVTGTAKGGFWGNGAQVSVILNSTNNKAYIQNAATVTPTTITKTYTATVGTSWTSTAPYTQTVTVNGILSTDNPIIDVVLTGTKDSDLKILESWSMVSRITTSANSITVICYEDKPTVSIPLQIKVVG